jgi:hypothetical protein
LALKLKLVNVLIDRWDLYPEKFCATEKPYQFRKPQRFCTVNLQQEKTCQHKKNRLSCCPVTDKGLQLIAGNQKQETKNLRGLSKRSGFVQNFFGQEEKIYKKFNTPLDRPILIGRMMYTFY